MNKINIDGDCQFLKDVESEPNYNGVPLGVYNLIITIGALKILLKGIQPSKHFVFKDVKKYFGVDGQPKTVLYKLETINKILKGEL
tara:strand:- start:51 stop:308 length:258 start_codon:yes stop_codon:yes gene_type:complete